MVLKASKTRSGAEQLSLECAGEKSLGRKRQMAEAVSMRGKEGVHESDDVGVVNSRRPDRHPFCPSDFGTKEPTSQSLATC